MTRKSRFLLIVGILLLAGGVGLWVAMPTFRTRQARRAIAKQKWEIALNHARWLLARNPEDPSVRLLFAEILSGQGNLNAALSQLDVAADDSVYASRVARRRGEILVLLDRASEAETSFKRCMDTAASAAEESIVSRILLVKTYRWQGRHFEAQSLLEELYRASDQAGDSATSLMALVQMFLVDYADYEAIDVNRMLRRFVANDPQNVPARIALARLEIQQDPEAAARELESCLRVAPDNSECRDALLDYGLNIAGMEPDSLEPILDGWPKERRGFQFFRWLGEIRFKQGQIDEAVQAFSRSIELRPDIAGTHHQLGMALVRNGREDEATREFERSAELGNLLDSEQIKSILTAIPPRVEAGRAIPADVPVFTKVASLYENVGRPEMAQRWRSAAERL